MSVVAETPSAGPPACSEGAIVRYLFRGIVKETGKLVEGHVEAPHPDEAYGLLSNNGIVTESLQPDPKPMGLTAVPAAVPQISDALDSALDSSSSQVSFDDLTERYRGKKVWVLDRDKIRHRVAQVVDSALVLSLADAELSSQARERVAQAIRGLFNDNANLATERNADSIQGQRVTTPQGGLPSNAQIDDQIARLSDVVRQAEGLISTMAAALRGAGSGRRRFVATGPSGGGEQNAVLLEIFKSNVELRRAIAQTAPSGAPALPAPNAN